MPVISRFSGIVMVLDWTYQNREALLDDWNWARERKPLKPIPPLE